MVGKCVDYELAIAQSRFGIKHTFANRELIRVELGI